MKLLVIIVRGRSRNKLAQKLARAKIASTVMNSESGPLRQKKAVFMAIVPKERIEEIKKMVHGTCTKQIVASGEVSSSEPGEFVMPEGGDIINNCAATIMEVEIDKLDHV